MENWSAYPPGSKQPPVKSTLSLQFESLDVPTDKVGGYVAAYSSRILGGPSTFRVVNFGPASVENLSIELSSPTLQAMSSLYWRTLGLDEAVTFKVDIPFDTPRQVIVRWSQGEWSFDRTTELPVGEVD